MVTIFFCDSVNLLPCAKILKFDFFWQKKCYRHILGPIPFLYIFEVGSSSKHPLKLVNTKVGRVYR